MKLLTEGLLDANKLVVGIALAAVALATLVYLLRRILRRSRPRFPGGQRSG